MTQQSLLADIISVFSMRSQTANDVTLSWWGVQYAIKPKIIITIITSLDQCLCVGEKYPTGREFSLEFNFRYFANAQFAKFKFRLIIDFHKLCIDSLYKRFSTIKIGWYFNRWIWQVSARSSKFCVYFHPVG